MFPCKNLLSRKPIGRSRACTKNGARTDLVIPMMSQGVALVRVFFLGYTCASDISSLAMNFPETGKKNLKTM